MGKRQLFSKKESMETNQIVWEGLPAANITKEQLLQEKLLQTREKNSKILIGKKTLSKSQKKYNQQRLLFQIDHFVNQSVTTKLTADNQAARN